MANSLLFIGGTGTISSACVSLAVERGFSVTTVNRGITDRATPSDVELLVGDANDHESLSAAVEGREFDVVADFRAFTPDEVSARLELFRGQVGQYVFVSSATVYRKPPARPIVESAPRSNPDWQYARDKIAAEDVLAAAWQEDRYPVTIVRPSHTYDQRTPPLYGGWTQIVRMREGRPVVVHDDGASEWTLTHSRDFAPPFVGLLGDSRAHGEAFHITSNDVFTWNQIFEILARTAGAPSPQLVHVPSHAIARVDADWGAALLGDMAHSLVFDNSKVESLVGRFEVGTSFPDGAHEIVEWFDADPARQSRDPRFEAVVEQLLAHQD
jgi:nucleoside-diphosphate-sugar epimerase